MYVALSLGDSALSIDRDDSLDAVAGPAVMPWGERVSQVRDPDGFVVHLGSPAP